MSCSPIEDFLAAVVVKLEMK